MVVAIVLLLTVAFLIYKLTRKPDNYPPGPPLWPVLGNAPLMRSKKSFLLARDLRRAYGNVVGLRLFSQPILLVSGLSEVREALAKPEFQGRPLGAIRELEDDRTGIVFLEGRQWQEHRRFALRHLRELGMGRHAMERCVTEEAVALMRDARRLAGDAWRRPVPVHDLVSASGVNIILQLLAARRFDRLDPRMRELMAVVRATTSVLDSTGGVANCFPFLLRHLPSLTEYPAVKRAKQHIRSYCYSMIEKHEEDMDKERKEDLIYFYLQQITKEDENEFFNKKQLAGLISDLFIAGSDTTTGALAYGILHMALSADVQAKVQQELDTVVGKERLPTTEDRQRLPYCEATINEILRFANVVPLSVPHAAITDTTFKGYFIPKGTRILLNLFDLHMDPDYWGDPQDFRPERFLDETGRVRKDEALLPFGQGKRSCIGESLARTNLFITFTSLLQNFSLSLPDGQERPSTEHMGGITVTTQPFSVVMSPRNSCKLY
ncbi:methyl farnesoate epoxidase-like [Bacillus rossius redtenbacheri]|uniref:methyl farnesoate epoxidase-like n=1 Tax=Bacillus rossius redtenbacheri TaxID=93214 RepID=UPI002FDECF1E